jgi:hypothetical protein
MPSSPRTVRLNLSLRLHDYRIYVTAQRSLRRIMGPRAPDVDALIRAQLTGRDVPGIADEYLDRVGWPPVAGRMITLRVLPQPAPRRGLTRAKRPEARSSR